LRLSCRVPFSSEMHNGLHPNHQAFKPSAGIIPVPNLPKQRNMSEVKGPEGGFNKIDV